MTALTISLPDEDARRLLDAAKERGITPEELARAWLEAKLAAKPARRKNTLKFARGLATTMAPPPADDDTKRWLDERRAERYEK